MSSSPLCHYRSMFTAVMLALLGPALLWPQPPKPDTVEVLPLAAIIDSPPLKDSLEDIIASARRQAEPGNEPMYKSSRVESKIFQGCFIPGRPNPGKKNVTLAIFSDDGCEVAVNGKVILPRFEKPQHLPDVTKDDIPKNQQAKNVDRISFHVLNGSDGKGALWEAGKVYHIRIKYSNIVFTGATDIDGCTLFAFDGGGQVVQIDPVTAGFDITPKSKINTVTNPAGIVILHEKPSKAQQDEDLALTEENAAIIEFTRPKTGLNNKVTSTIKSVDKVTGKDDPSGGKAAFLVPRAGMPPDIGKTTITAGRSVRVYGIKEGRIRIEAALMDDKDCTETYEAFVLRQRTVPFRVQLVQGPTGGTDTNPAQAEEHIRAANVYLRQLGIRLVPDSNTKITEQKDVETKLVKAGFFEVKVKDAALTTDIGPNTGKRTIRLNERPNVLQICYVKDIAPGRIGGPRPAGRTISHPDNPARVEIITADKQKLIVPGVRLTYRIVAGDMAREHVMRMFPGEPHPDARDTWVLS